MQSDFAVRTGAQAMATTCSQFALNGFVTVEFAVDDYVYSFVFVGDRLISSGEIDDAEAGVPQRDAVVGRNPMALTVRTAVVEALRGPLQLRFRDRITAREDGDYSAHAEVLPGNCKVFFDSSSYVAQLFKEQTDGFDSAVKVRDVELFVGGVEVVVGQAEAHHDAGNFQHILEVGDDGNRSAGADEDGVFLEHVVQGFGGGLDVRDCRFRPRKPDLCCAR